MKLDINTLGVKKEDINASYYRKINRIIANKIAHFLNKNTKITPNQITFLLFLSNFAIAYLFYKASLSYTLIGGISFILYYLIDQVNGSLARIQLKASDLGTWYDHLNDSFGLAIIFLAAALGAFNKNQNYLIFIFAFLAVTSYLFKTLMYQMFRRLFDFSNKQIEKEKSKMKILKNFFYDGSFIVPVFGIFSIINRVEVGLIFLGIYGIIFVLAQFIYTTKNIIRNT